MPSPDPSTGTARASRVAPLSLPARPELTSGRRVGVLLLHGFTGSPASIRTWAGGLNARGHAVEVPLLPGHGTTWQQLNRTTWQEWYAASEAALARLAARVDTVVVGGLSLGATQALLLAARHGSEIAGVVSLNVSLDNRDPRRFALPVVKRLKGSLRGITDDVRRPGQTEHGYDRVPLRAAHSVLGLYRTLRPELGAVTQPLLVLRSVTDHVADPGSHRLLLGAVSSRDVTEVLLHESFHVATLDHDADTVVEETAAFVARVTDAGPTVPAQARAQVSERQVSERLVSERSVSERSVSESMGRAPSVGGGG